MTVNKEHLLKIKQHILEEPSRLYMADWIEHHAPGTIVIDQYNKQNIQQTVPQCGTVCCIAGWSSVLRGREYMNTSDEQAYLDVSSRLFYPNKWPEDLFERYQNSTSTSEKAQVAADAIDLIIVGDGYFPDNEEAEDDNE